MKAKLLVRALNGVLSLCLACNSIAATASQWWLVSSSGSGHDEHAFFVDRESMRTVSGGVEAWTLEINETTKEEKEIKTLERYGCSDRSRTLLSAIFFDASLRVSKSFEWKSYEQNREPVSPDSVGEAKWKFVCLGAQSDDILLKEPPEDFASGYFLMP